MDKRSRPQEYLSYGCEVHYDGVIIKRIHLVFCIDIQKCKLYTYKIVLFYKKSRSKYHYEKNGNYNTE